MKKITPENIEACILDLFEGNLTVEESEAVMCFLKLHPEWKKKLDAMDMLPTLDSADECLYDWEKLKKEKGWDRLRGSQSEFLIGKLEGTLSAQEEEELNAQLMKDDTLAREWSMYRQLVLLSQPDEQTGMNTWLKKGLPVITSGNFLQVFIMAAETRDDRLLENVKRYLKQHPTSNTEWELAQQLTLMPALHERMPGKESLKKRQRTVPVYLRWSYAAAAVVLLVFSITYLIPGNDNVGTLAQKNANAKNVDTTPLMHHPVKNRVAVTPTVKKQDVNNNVHLHNVTQNTIHSSMPRHAAITPEQRKPVQINYILVLHKTSDFTFYPPNDSLCLTCHNHTPPTALAFYENPDSIRSESFHPSDKDVNFTAMKNIVSRVSHGYVEVDRLQSDAQHTFMISVGRWKFIRKKKSGSR